MAAAAAAVARAESDADARQYAADSVDRAKNLLGDMREASEAKNYDEARSLAERAIAAAEQAIRDGATGKARAAEAAAAAATTDETAAEKRARDDATALVAAAKTSLAETERALAAARNVAGITLAFATTTNELQQIGRSLTAADADITNKNYSAASTKAQTARTAIVAIQRRVADAVQAANRKK
jgi:hypothetical protein